VNLVGRHIEVSAGIPVLPCDCIIVQDLSVRVVKRAFQTLAWAVVYIVFKHSIAHLVLLLEHYHLHFVTGTIFYVSIVVLIAYTRVRQDLTSYDTY
jgi:hypothetical protein